MAASNPVPQSKLTPANGPVRPLRFNLPRTPMPSLPALQDDRAVRPSSLVNASLPLCCISSMPVTVASMSSKRFNFNRYPSRSEDRPHLYGPSYERIMTPSLPSSSHFSSVSINSASLLQQICSTILTPFRLLVAQNAASRRVRKGWSEYLSNTQSRIQSAGLSSDMTMLTVSRYAEGEVGSP